MVLALLPVTPDPDQRKVKLTTRVSTLCPANNTKKPCWILQHLHIEERNRAHPQYLIFRALTGSLTEKTSQDWKARLLKQIQVHMQLNEGSIIRTSVLDSQSMENPSDIASIKPLKLTAYAWAKLPQLVLHWGFFSASFFWSQNTGFIPHQPKLTVTLVMLASILTSVKGIPLANNYSVAFQNTAHNVHLKTGSSELLHEDDAASSHWLAFIPQAGVWVNALSKSILQSFSTLLLPLWAIPLTWSHSIC